MQENNICFIKIRKLNWSLSHKTLKTLYTGGIQPLLLYGAPVWAEKIENTSHRKKLTRVQRLINIKIAKAYRTVSNDSLCRITGLTRIHIKIKKRQNYTKFSEETGTRTYKLTTTDYPNNDFIQQTGP
jgi:hypothetical protein